MKGCVDVDRISVINLGMVNVYLLKGEKGCVLVDTGTKGSDVKILEAVKAQGFEPADIKLIVLTHGHSDHFGSLHTLVDKTGAEVLVHQKEYDLMATAGDDGVRGFSIFMKLLIGMATKLSKNQSKSQEYKADILIEDTYDLSPYGIDGKLIWTPGHTKGSISVLLGDGKAVIGDSLMAMMPWSKPKRPMLGYDMNLIKKSMNQLIDLGANRFYLSHGKDYDVEIIKKALTKFN
ncbi:MAG: MBL fold metallo-hydrolase [Clostridiales bacterium]|nr:MBL fold metallo-hydrolase [Clostridiales bacterium]